MILKVVSCLGLSHFIFVLQTAVRPDGTVTTTSIKCLWGLAFATAPFSLLREIFHIINHHLSFIISSFFLSFLYFLTFHATSFSLRFIISDVHLVFSHFTSSFFTLSLHSIHITVLHSLFFSSLRFLLYIFFLIIKPAYISFFLICLFPSSPFSSHFPFTPNPFSLPLLLCSLSRFHLVPSFFLSFVLLFPHFLFYTILLPFPFYFSSFNSFLKILFSFCPIQILRYKYPSVFLRGLLLLLLHLLVLPVLV